MATSDIEQQAVNTIRTLSMDGVQAANSGHPGTPMAPGAGGLRFVQRSDELRSGRAQLARPRPVHSLLRPRLDAALLDLAPGRRSVRKAPTKPAVSLDDIRNFRQIGSQCPGHPEHGHTSGVETTTGPLGQGIANSVGMAIASRWKAAKYNRPGFDIFGNNVYAVCSDGDLMEGLSSEAASLAGHLKLSNLCWIYDDNGITIEGETDLAFSEDMAARFAGYGWNVVEVEDINDLDALRGAIGVFPRSDERRAHADHRQVGNRLGCAEQQGTAAAHGAPLGAEEIALDETGLRLPRDEQFHVPEERDGTCSRKASGTRGKAAREAWEAKYAEYTPSSSPGDWPRTGDDASAATCPRAGTPTLPRSKPTPRGWPAAPRRARSSTRLPKTCPGCWADRPTWPPRTKTLLKFDGAGDFGGHEPRRAQLPLRHPRARHGRRLQRHGPVRAAALRRHVLRLLRLLAGPRSDWRP